MTDPDPMRLFVAFDPPPDAAAELRRALAPVRARRPDLRWAPVESWHITLAFLGNVDADVVPKLEERLARVAARHPAQKLALAGAGHFGDRVLWTGVHGDARALKALVAGVRRAADKCGVTADAKPWRGHLTLARTTHRADRGDAPTPAALAAELADFTGTAWPADTLRLVQSIPGSDPAHYRDVATWPMRGKAERFR